MRKFRKKGRNREASPPLPFIASHSVGKEKTFSTAPKFEDRGSTEKTTSRKKGPPRSSSSLLSSGKEINCAEVNCGASNNSISEAEKGIAARSVPQKTGIAIRDVQNMQILTHRQRKDEDFFCRSKFMIMRRRDVFVNLGQSYRICDSFATYLSSAFFFLLLLPQTVGFFPPFPPAICIDST